MHPRPSQVAGPAVLDRQVERAVDAILKKLKQLDGQGPRSKVRRSLSAKQREVFEEALDYAIEAGMVVESFEEGQGEDKHILHLAEEEM